MEYMTAQQHLANQVNANNTTQMDPNTAQNLLQMQYQLSQNANQQQRVIMVPRNDTYKRREAFDEKPMWMVPTSKRIARSKAAQPRQKAKRGSLEP